MGRWFRIFISLVLVALMGQGLVSGIQAREFHLEESWSRVAKWRLEFLTDQAQAEEPLSQASVEDITPDPIPTTQNPFPTSAITEMPTPSSLPSSSISLSPSPSPSLSISPQAPSVSITPSLLSPTPTTDQTVTPSPPEPGAGSDVPTPSVPLSPEPTISQVVSPTPTPTVPSTPTPTPTDNPTILSQGSSEPPSPPESSLVEKFTTESRQAAESIEKQIQNQNQKNPEIMVPFLDVLTPQPKSYDYKQPLSSGEATTLSGVGTAAFSLAAFLEKLGPLRKYLRGILSFFR